MRDDDPPKRLATIPKGTLFSITNDEYSSYSLHGHFRALADIDAEQLRSQWLAAHPEQATQYNFDEDKFLAWVWKLQIMEPVDCFEWHLHDYGDADKMDVTPECRRNP